MAKRFEKIEAAVRAEAATMTNEQKYAKVIEYRDAANAVAQDGTKQSAAKWRKAATMRDIWEESWVGSL